MHGIMSCCIKHIIKTDLLAYVVLVQASLIPRLFVGATYTRLGTDSKWQIGDSRLNFSGTFWRLVRCITMGTERWVGSIWPTALIHEQSTNHISLCKVTPCAGHVWLSAVWLRWFMLYNYLCIYNVSRSPTWMGTGCPERVCKLMYMHFLSW